jgi:hypothetical protein
MGMPIQNNQPKISFGQYVQNFQNNQLPRDPNYGYQNFPQPALTIPQRAQFPMGSPSHSMIDDPNFQHNSLGQTPSPTLDPSWLGVTQPPRSHDPFSRPISDPPRSLISPHLATQCLLHEVSILKSKATLLPTPPQPNPTKFSLHLKGIKGMQILETVNFFYSKIFGGQNPATNSKFVTLVNAMFEFVEIHQDDFKKHQSDSIAGCTLYLVCTSLEVNKKVFLEILRPLKRHLFKKVENIKKAACYKVLKTAFVKLLKKKKF